MNKYYEEGLDPRDLQVKISEMLVATAEKADSMIDDAVTQVIRLLRRAMKMDVVFVSEFTDGMRVIKKVDALPGAPAFAEGHSDPVEETYSQRVVDGRLPEMIPNVAALLRIQMCPIRHFQLEPS
jgi:hypothetical protein